MVRSIRPRAPYLIGVSLPAERKRLSKALFVLPVGIDSEVDDQPIVVIHIQPGVGPFKASQVDKEGRVDTYSIVRYFIVKPPGVAPEIVAGGTNGVHIPIQLLALRVCSTALKRKDVADIEALRGGS